MDRTTDELAERVFGALLGTVDVLSIHVGDRLGWYRSLVDDGPATPAELAERTSTEPRYAREWLEQQAVTGFLAVSEEGSPAQRRFALTSAAAEVFTDTASLSYLAPFARMFAAVGPVLPALLDAYRHGGGVSWEQLGDDARQAQADGNRPWYDARLAPALAGISDVHEALSRPGVRILDVGCGGGFSTIALARAYPGAQVTGVDSDGPSIAMAMKNAADAGLSVTFRQGDAAVLGHDTYDVAFAFECVHDMARPVDVLRSVRRALVPGGFLIVMDEAVAEAFAPDGGDVERLMYGFSLFICLPDGLSSQPSAGTGTLMRPAVLREYALSAGFSSVDVLPVDDFGLWRFYRVC